MCLPHNTTPCHAGLHDVNGNGYRVVVTQINWPERLTRVIAGEVRRYRQERKMSTQQLDDKTAELGMRIPRSVLANLESGRRDTISAAEILVLAAALDVPPALLLFPIGRRELMDALPDMPLQPWQAFTWFTGEREFAIFTGAGARLAALTGPPDSGGEISMFRQHELHERSWRRAWWSLQNATKAVREAATAEEAQTQQAVSENMTEQVNAAEDDLRMIRRRMKEQGLIPPPLPDELAHIDDASWNHAVRTSAVLPVQVRPVAEILGMGRPVLLDLSEMEPSGREQVTELVSGLMREMHGTAELLPPAGEKLRLTPGDAGEDGPRALAGFRQALDALTEGKG
jgi:transcriptional regulator with XRE-family HTH domain